MINEKESHMEKTLRILNLIFFIAMIVVNALGEFLPLGVGSTGAISEKYKNLFTPAPITFSIWGIIYLLVGYFVVYQMISSAKNWYSTEVVKAVGFWFIVSCIMNIGWMFSWHYDMIYLSVAYMVGLLLSLIMVTTEFQHLDSPPLLARVAGYGFYIYLGWICAATIANISVLLVKLNWGRWGMSEQIWTMIVILVGAGIGMLLILCNRNYISAAAIIWAYCGILIKHVGQKGYAGQYPIIIATVLIAIVLILSTGVLKFVQD